MLEILSTALPPLNPAYNPPPRFHTKMLQRREVILNSFVVKKQKKRPFRCAFIRCYTPTSPKNKKFTCLSLQ